MPIRVSHQIPDAPPARRLPDRQCLHGHSFPGGGRRSGCGRRPFVFGRRHPIWRHWPSTSASPGKAIGLVGRALSYPGHPRKMACGAKSQSPLANVRPAASVRGSGALRAVGHCQSQPSGKPQDAEVPFIEWQYNTAAPTTCGDEPSGCCCRFCRVRQLSP